jgi:hypothetical protein
MVLSCNDGRCNAPRWMGRALFAAALYHLAAGFWTFGWPHMWFDWLGMERPNHPALWRATGLAAAALGVGFLIAARDPVRSWLIVLVGWLKSSLAIAVFLLALLASEVPPSAAGLVILGNLIWWTAFSGILWACLRAHAGVPPDRAEPLSVAEATTSYRLSSGETLAEASGEHLLVMVFLRHFGCTFTRQILRGLESLENEAAARGARLVLVHMLRSGQETRYLDTTAAEIGRISDPRCELYRALGLGKGGFIELFGPRVWWRGILSIFKGCGVGHLAGDGLQMPGVFLMKDGRVIASQPARSACDLPDLPRLFEGLPSQASRESLTA